MSRVPKVLIVDDNTANRELLHAFLDDSDLELHEAASGEEALEVAARIDPDLVLLDVRMPGIDGLETTRRLKDRSRDRYLPVVLVTALGDPASRLAGLRAGADEFLSKPIDQHELKARVTNLLALRAKDVTLVHSNVELIELHRFRKEMTSMLVHDLKNPMAIVLSNVEFLLERIESDDPDINDALGDTKVATQRVLRLLENLADLARIEAGRFTLKRARTPVAQLLAPILHERQHLVRQKEVQLETDLPDHVSMNADTELLTRLVANVLDNALRHTPRGGRIALACVTFQGRTRLRIANNGPAIPPEARGRIFEKYGCGSSIHGRMTLGLGLYFCRLAAEAHGGRLWVEEEIELPTVFHLELPA